METPELRHEWASRKVLVGQEAPCLLFGEAYLALGGPQLHIYRAHPYSRPHLPGRSTETSALPWG